MPALIGPVIAGFAIARLGVDVPFWCCWVGNLALVAALIWWRAPRRAKETLPAERLISAMMTGVRYVRYSREMDATLIRAVAFFPFASAYLALLPLVARTQMRGGPEVYGALMAAIGAGSIAASFALKLAEGAVGTRPACRARHDRHHPRPSPVRRGARAPCLRCSAA